MSEPFTGTYDPVTFGSKLYDWEQCPDCQGTGHQWTVRGSLDDLTEWCPTCNGSGLVYDGDEDDDE